jgi:hypothetical protein
MPNTTGTNTPFDTNPQTMSLSSPELLGFGLRPSSGILETGSVSVLRWRETPTLLGPLEEANVNH